MKSNFHTMTTPRGSSPSRSTSRHGVEQRTKFSANNHKATKAISENTFFAWTSNNFYRTSYNDMSSRVSKTASITLHKFLFSRLQRTRTLCFQATLAICPDTTLTTTWLPSAGLSRPERSSTNKLLTSLRMALQRPGKFITVVKWCSSRFNKSLIPVVDETLEATSRRYGRRTEQETAPNMKPRDLSFTTFRFSYLNPNKHDLPNFRTRTIQKFDSTSKLRVLEKSDNLMTGYELNRQLWDGTTWRTEKNLHTDQIRTTYRNQFNKPKPFHLNKLRDTTGRLKKRFNIYDISDNPTSAPQWALMCRTLLFQWKKPQTRY